MRKTKEMLRIELQYKKDIRDILYDLYYTQDLTLYEAAEILGVTHSTLSYWLKRFDMDPKQLAKKAGTA